MVRRPATLPARSAVADVVGDLARPSAFQSRVLGIPEECDVFLGGGRGGGKSYTLALLVLRYVEQYGAKARVLYVRQSHKGCADFEALCLELFGAIYGRALRFNAQEGVFRFPNGATLEINQIEGPADYAKYQGRSFGLLLIDEAGQFATPDLLDRLRSNLRGPKGMPIRCVMAANPGDVGHQWIAKRYVFQSAPWVPFYEGQSKRTWVCAPSTFLDNPFIDQAAYRRQLEASCPSDPELLRAWLDGDWAIARGAYFAVVLDEKRSAVDPWPTLPKYRGAPWDAYLAHDFGSSAPSCTYVVAKSPGTEAFGRWFARDSLVLVDELATNEPGSLTKGLGWTVPKLADAITEMCARWDIAAEGVADDACFAKTGHGAGSIADEFRLREVYFFPAQKGSRISGWQTMRRLLSDAGKPDVPGLYIARSSEYFWATVPYLARDPRRVEDVRSDGPDHAADCARYACLRESRIVTQYDMYDGWNQADAARRFRANGWKR